MIGAIFLTMMGLGFGAMAWVMSAHPGPFFACASLSVFMLGAVLWDAIDSMDFKWWQKHVRCPRSL